MSKIEWCDLVLNPVVGCSKCSPGCDNCYAEKFAARLARNPNSKIAAKYSGVVDEHGRWTGRLSEEGWECLTRLTGMMHSPSKRIFIGSMTDIFHENMDQVSFNELVDLMTYTGSRHTFLLLTKRPARAQDMINAYEKQELPKNVWLGVTVCNQLEAEEKLPILMEIPAPKRFVSVEPMLEPVDVGKWLPDCYECGACGTRMARHELPDLGCETCGFCGPDTYAVWGDGPSPVCPECHGENTGPMCPNCGFDMLIEGLTTVSLDWIICGAETGKGARPMILEWARDLRDQCKRAYVPFFFKKAGNKTPIPADLMIREFPEPKRHCWGEI